MLAPTCRICSIHIFVLWLINICIGELELLWYDSMDNYTLHWTSFGGSSQILNDGSNTYCTTSPNCVQIRGYVNGDDWIIRTISLPIISNIDAYNSFRLQFDVILFDMENVNFCQIGYKYDTQTTYNTIRSYGGSSSTNTLPLKLLNETSSINKDINAQILYIKLETNGDSSGGNDYCYFDNVYLFGYILDDNNAIYYDNMDDIISTGWSKSNNLSITQYTGSYCSDGGCVQIGGYDATDNSIYNSISNINEYFDLIIEYDVYFRNMENDNSCQVWYRYDTDPTHDYYLLQSIAGGNGDYLDNNRIVTIHDDPQYTNSSILYIKLATFGNSVSGNDYCYFDNVYVKGTVLNDSNKAILSEQIASRKQMDNDLEHIIIIGDMGGTPNAPYYTEEQVITADILSSVAKYYNISGIIALGDNMYNTGVDNEYDTRFRDTFENVYTHTNIVDINWYFTTGNHDYGKNITGEVEYSKHSKRWNFPSLYYTKSWFFGENNDIELLWIALDTYILCGLVTDSSTQEDCIPPNAVQAAIHWKWLNDTLSASNATFTLVGGHTPIYSYAYHGPTVQLIDELNPLLEYHKVNAYIFGHDHVVQFIEDNTTSTNFVQHIGSGAGHGCRDTFTHINSELNPNRNALKYMDCDQGGFVRLTIDIKKITMQAFYYLSNSVNVQFFTGIWSANTLKYQTINDILYGTISPTPSPTLNPIPSPTNNPTPSPTNIPTPSPTDNPTPSPTLDPTPSPTNIPTPSPTNIPTPSPTDNPLSLNSPTTSPTDSTLSPTNHPTPSPTDNPTPSPTDNPLAFGESNNPTLDPTNHPTQSLSNNPTTNPISKTLSECDTECKVNDGTIMIKVTLWFQQWIVYDINNIECWLYHIFSRWFDSFDFIDKFDVCDIEISMIYGGENNNNNNNDYECISPPCLWNKNNNNNDNDRRLLSGDSDGNTTMIIISNDQDSYNKINGLSLDLIENEFEEQFNDSFAIQMNVNVEIESFEDEEEKGKEEIDGLSVNAIEIIIVISIIFIILIILMIILCILYKTRKNKKMNRTKMKTNTTEMISATRIPTAEPIYVE